MTLMKLAAATLAVAALLLSGCTDRLGGGAEATGPAAVPDLVGLYGDEAKDLLGEVGLKADFEAVDGKAVLMSSRWVVIEQDPLPGVEAEGGSDITLMVARPEDAREVRAVRIVLDALGDAPIWEDTTATATFVDENEVCVDRFWGSDGEGRVAGGNAGYVIVGPDETISEPQDGSCADYSTAGAAAPQFTRADCDLIVDAPAMAVVCAVDFETWPLAVPVGIMACEIGFDAPYPVTFTDSEGTVYALNGTALDQTDLPSIDAIWADNPDFEGLKIDISPLIDVGLALCP